MKYFTFHILGLPHTVSSKDYNACAYTQKVVKFGKMMTERGHTVIHYGHEDSDLICTEHVPVLTNEDFDKCYGTHDWKTQFFKYDTGDHAYQTFYKNAIREIGLRKKKNDFILPFWGAGVRPVCDAHPDLICVEPGIGYAGGHWARWKVFESYAIYHAYCGLKNVGQCNQDWYDVVIPNYFDEEDFEFQEKKEDYFLYLGRVYAGKGVNIAIETCNKIGAKLIIAGQGNLSDFKHLGLGENIQHVGYADTETRKKLMAGAKGIFLPSMYVEPFGGVQIEALLSGTPTITTDWGAFAENNIQGVTGYRCRTFADFVAAAQNVGNIRPMDCRRQGERFVLSSVAPMYEKYFNDVMNVHAGKGWYELNDVPYAPCDFDLIEAEEFTQAKSIARWVKQEGYVSVADVGCGPGIYTQAMIDLGLDAVGYDNDIRKSLDYVLPLDLTKEEIPKRAECVMCLEVMEHIDNRHAESVISKIVKASTGIVIFSAATIGQGGDGHINCQLKEYWEKMFNALGWYRDAELEMSLRRVVMSDTYMGWFSNNMMIFNSNQTKP